MKLFGLDPTQLAAASDQLMQALTATARNTEAISSRLDAIDRGQAEIKALIGVLRGQLLQIGAMEAEIGHLREQIADTRADFLSAAESAGSGV